MSGIMTRIMTVVFACILLAGCERFPFETPAAPRVETTSNPRPNRSLGADQSENKVVINNNVVIGQQCVLKLWIVWPTREVTSFEEYLSRNKINRYSTYGFSTSDLLPGFIAYYAPEKPDPWSPDNPFFSQEPQ